MPGSYVRYKEHTFQSRMPQELEAFVAFNHVGANVRETWYMDKPVSSLYVPLEVSHDDAEMLDKYFHTYTKETDVDGLDEFLYISRFPELCEFTATCETAVDGLLYGFEPRDVASFIEDNEGSISRSN